MNENEAVVLRAEMRLLNRKHQAQLDRIVTDARPRAVRAIQNAEASVQIEIEDIGLRNSLIDCIEQEFKSAAGCR